jgi:transcription initiation factor TFIIH subunit 2
MIMHEFCRVSIVGVAAEVNVCRRMADETGGTYSVALGESHLEELMLGHAPPPAATAANMGAELVRSRGGAMGKCCVTSVH